MLVAQQTAPRIWYDQQTRELRSVMSLDSCFDTLRFLARSSELKETRLTTAAGWMELAIDGDGEPIVGRWPLRRRRVQHANGQFIAAAHTSCGRFDRTMTMRVPSDVSSADSGSMLNAEGRRQSISGNSSSAHPASCCAGRRVHGVQWVVSTSRRAANDVR
jgi:hypothetical protein